LSCAFPAARIPSPVLRESVTIARILCRSIRRGCRGRCAQPVLQADCSGRRAQAPHGEAWLVGCEFEKPLTDDEIKQLLGPVV